MATKPVLYRISAPEKDFTGDVGGCHFAKGAYEGEVGDGPLGYFQSAGYTVEELKGGRSKTTATDDADTQAVIDAKVAEATAAIQADADAKVAAATEQQNTGGTTT